LWSYSKWNRRIGDNEFEGSEERKRSLRGDDQGRNPIYPGQVPKQTKNDSKDWNVEARNWRIQGIGQTYQGRECTVEQTTCIGLC